MIFKDEFKLSKSVPENYTSKTSKVHHYNIVFSPKNLDTYWGELTFMTYFSQNPDLKSNASWIPISIKVLGYADPDTTDIEISLSSYDVTIINGYPTYTIEYIYQLLQEGATIKSYQKGGNTIVTSSGGASSKGKAQFTFTIKEDAIIFEDVTPSTSLHNNLSSIYGDIFEYGSNLYVTKTASFR
ncbi:hypothetical protein [uncultured Dokdonia sp.]|uniref:hypothetical protein n=1 Tax=uncultured Dokdonia sp. TaxID=575653 RepID=UPI0026279B4A|nr:hypothetical protein [uncultured Dokdonia sp.]